ncbi:MAG: AgmX/PglI C-terminal domain-containing protein [Proteobacteria bacterium]|nr:MAG: AgmX/PglI C-terminal domain-containing protein [Pseudomonadota bacterium]
MKSIISLVLCLTLLSAVATAAAIDREKIRQVVKKHEKDIRACYESQLTKEPNLSGKLVVDWDIDDEGKVLNAAVNANSTDLKNAAVAGCVIKHLQTWTFPVAAKGEKVSVTYPWSFSN